MDLNLRRPAVEDGCDHLPELSARIEKKGLVWGIGLPEGLRWRIG